MFETLDSEHSELKWLKTTKTLLPPTPGHTSDPPPLICDLFPVDYDRYLGLQVLRNNIEKFEASQQDKIIWNEGTFDEDQIKTFIETLLTLETDTVIYCYYDVNCLCVPNRATPALFFRGMISDIPYISTQDQTRCFPTYCWSEDRSWITFSDVDTPVTLFAGSDVLGTKLSSKLPFNVTDLSKGAFATYDFWIEIATGLRS